MGNFLLRLSQFFPFHPANLMNFSDIVTVELSDKKKYEFYLLTLLKIRIVVHFVR